ncbi:hypothetical protein KKG83_05885 [Candidatus Micrarchaeota archaeon]|nr:hypothetical protein [Candidatus Micrarchaeota archaeon]MBU2476973.1 hypothetical protein [Candidatus Micrarchaeota archaeon]
MKKLLVFLILLFFVTNVSSSPQPVYKVEFNFDYELKEPVQIIDANIHTCKDDSCSVIESSEYLGDFPKEFVFMQGYCAENKCVAYYYNIYREPAHKLVVNFSDKTRESNLFKFSATHDRSFNVTVTESGLIVSENLASTDLVIGIGWFVLLSIIFLILVLPTAWLIFRKDIPSISLNFLFSLFAANSITIISFWILTNSFSLIKYFFGTVSTKIDTYFGPLLFLLVISTAVGSYLIYLLNKKKLMLKKAFILALIINVIFPAIFLFFYIMFVLQFV